MYRGREDVSRKGRCIEGGKMYRGIDSDRLFGGGGVYGNGNPQLRQSLSY